MTDAPPAPPSPSPQLRWGPRRPGLGLRREVALLFPIALLVLAGLAIFALLSYRQAVERLGEERRIEAARLARGVAGALRGAPAPRPETLRALVPQALGVAVLDEQGLPVAQVGEIAPYALPGALAAGGGSPAAGPDELLGSAVAGFAPLATTGRRRWVRVDLPAATLAAQGRAVRLLTPLVFSVSLAVCVLVLLFLRHAFAPYDTLLERAKQAGELGGDGEDEITSLVSTFERALAALGHRGRAEDDIAALERALAPSLESGLLLLDRDGRVLALNPVGAALLGLAPPPAGTPLATALAAQPALAGLVLEAVASGRGVNRREVEIAAAGGRRTLGLTLHPLRRDDGAARGFLALFADLTEVHRRDDEARRAQNLAQLGELSAGLAHELRNSLATMRGYLTLIERGPGAQAAAEHFAEIRRE
ncbi:MAG TPA: PAS domain-containing protein, partial [Thermoanaerobaculia bacterium]|nr:PAS domain-containing protein [Thermoanaerobaculia bacterium]